MSTSLELPPELKIRIDRIARAQRRSPHWIMIEAIRQFAEREDGRRGTSVEDNWASFHDRAEDDDAADAFATTIRSEEIADALRRYADSKTPLDKFLALAGAGAGFKSKQDIDAYIDEIRAR